MPWSSRASTLVASTMNTSPTVEQLPDAGHPKPQSSLVGQRGRVRPERQRAQGARASMDLTRELGAVGLDGADSG